MMRFLLLIAQISHHPQLGYNYKLFCVLLFKIESVTIPNSVKYIGEKWIISLLIASKERYDPESRLRLLAIVIRL